MTGVPQVSSSVARKAGGIKSAGVLPAGMFRLQTYPAAGSPRVATLFDQAASGTVGDRGHKIYLDWGTPIGVTLALFHS